MRWGKEQDWDRLLFSEPEHGETCTLARVTCALFLVSAIVLGGCSRVVTKPSMPPPPPITAPELVARLHEQEASIQTLKALFSIEATGREIKGTQRMDAAMLYQRPNQIRLRAFARIGVPIFDLTLMDDYYQVRFFIQGKSVSGRLGDLNRQDGLGPSVFLGVQATLGNLNGTVISPADRLTLREEGGLYVLEVIPSGTGVVGPRRLWFDQRTLDMVRQEFLGPNGETQATISFQDFRPIGSRAIGVQGQVIPIVRPHVIKAEDSSGRAKLLLTFREIIPNPELSPQDWGHAANEALPKSEGTEAS
jgi:outer membrane lipoprotein-sorting protein